MVFNTSLPDRMYSHKVTGEPMTEDFDFYSDDFQQNPGATFKRMREHCPFHHSEVNGWYSVFRYEDIQNIVRDNETYSVKFGPGPLHAEPGTGAVLVSADPPLHGKQKQAIINAFNPDTIADMEDGIRAFVTQRLDELIPKGECDLIQDIAIQIPMWVICNMLDLDYERDWKRLREWVEVLAGSVFTKEEDETQLKARAEIAKSLINFFVPHIQKKLDLDIAGEDAGNDLIGLLAKGRVDGERISMGEMLSFAQFLLVAGSGTTTNLIGNFVDLMLRHPDQYDLLKKDPSLMDQAIEEVLRYEAPVHGLFRTNNVELQLGEHTIEPDSKICLMWGSANRDPEIYDNPDSFDITRDLKLLRQNMTFGRGLHKCLGAPLARLECKVFVEEFMRRVRAFERNGDAVPFPYATLNGLDHLPIRFLDAS